MSGQSCPACGAPFLQDFRPACDCALRARRAEQEKLAQERAAEEQKRQAEAETRKQEAVDRVFGQVAPPDATDTASNEVLALFDEPQPGPKPEPEPQDAREAAPLPREVAPEVQELSRTAPGGSRRGWRYGLIAGAAAVVAVTAGVASGALSPGGTDEQAAGGGSSTSVPDASTHSGEPDRASRNSARPTTSPNTPPSATETASPTPAELRRGAQGPEVVELQQRLRELQLYAGPTNGVFGPATENALSRFQGARDIQEQAGVYGPQTRTAVEAETSDPA